MRKYTVGLIVTLSSVLWMVGVAYGQDLQDLQLTDPPDNESLLNPRVTFIWDLPGGGGDVTYTLQVDNDPLFTSLEVNQVVVGTQSYTLSAAQPAHGGRDLLLAGERAAGRGDLHGARGVLRLQGADGDLRHRGV